MPQQVLLLGSQNKQVPRGAGLLDSVVHVKTSAALHLVLERLAACRPLIEARLRGCTFPFTLLLQTGDAHWHEPVSVLPHSTLLMVCCLQQSLGCLPDAACTDGDA